MTKWKYNTIDLSNIECASESINHRSQPRTQAKRSPDYAVSQGKEIMIKPIKVEYINIQKGSILMKNAFLSSI